MSLNLSFLLADQDDCSEVQSNTFIVSRILSGLGAFGVALQNYPAVEIFIQGIARTRAPGMAVISGLSQPLAFFSGVICGGLINFWMNVALLDRFFARMLSDNDYYYQSLSPWQQLQYFSGIFVFIVTGILFGLMAFTFSMEGPLAILSVAAGIFVAIIMTIQEIETWLSSYSSPIQEEEPLTYVQQWGKICGHIIAIGNVFALSLLFTLGLTESLIALQVAGITALIVGFTISFTFGAFTEYYFYNYYLANFCKELDKNWLLMLQTDSAYLGLLCISTNAFVNAALTYSGVELLASLLLGVGISLPSLPMITALSLVSAFFAGSASMVLGLDFWIGDRSTTQPIALTTIESTFFNASSLDSDPQLVTSGLSIDDTHSSLNTFLL